MQVCRSQFRTHQSSTVYGVPSRLHETAKSSSVADLLHCNIQNRLLCIKPVKKSEGSTLAFEEGLRPPSLELENHLNALVTPSLKNRSP